MTHSSHTLSKALVYALVVIALCTSSGFFLPNGMKRQSENTGLESFFQLAEGNDTCAYEIMEKYDCEEVGCTDQANYINYLYLQNCSGQGARVWYSILWVVILVLLLCLLASTADDYFCVVMDCIVEKLHIPPSIAGVTFLAFGNGAPDVFSLVISVLSGMTEIGVGANVGAGLFITTVVAGSVAVFSNCEVNKHAFLRDILFYTLCITYLIFVFFDKRIKLWEAIGFLVLYAIYITIVFLTPKKTKSPADKPILDSLTDTTQDPLLFSPGSPSADGKQGTGMQISAVVEAKLHAEPAKHIIEELVEKQSPNAELEKVLVAEEAPDTFDRRSVKELWSHAFAAFKERSFLGKLDYVLEYPFTLLRDMTCPIVADDRWNKYWLLITSFGAPFAFAVFAGMDISGPAFGAFPLWALLLIISVLFLLGNIFLTSFEQPLTGGFYLVILVLTGFVLSVLWISAIANELVSLLNAIGLMLNISPVILGLTILAWGNSLGDIVADVSLAIQGYPQMAVGGVFASPMFNMLIGMGSALTISCVKKGTTDLGKDTASINLTFVFLMISLVSSIIAVPSMKYKIKKGYGAYLYCLYGVYLVLNILVALNVIRIPFITPN
ncbi:hypothetical protein WA577_000720 [Blastocystis sp. JDR]